MSLILQVPSKPASPRVGVVNYAARRAGRRTPLLKRLFDGLDATWTAAAFAEENEAGTARQIFSARAARHRP